MNVLTRGGETRSGNINGQGERMKLKTLSNILYARFDGREFTPCTRRSHTPSHGWCIVTDGMITQAIRNAGLPTDKFHGPTDMEPMTQAPIEIVAFAKRALRQDPNDIAERTRVRNNQPRVYDNPKEHDRYTVVWPEPIRQGRDGRRWYKMVSMSANPKGPDGTLLEIEVDSKPDEGKHELGHPIDPTKLPGPCLEILKHSQN